MTASHPAPVIVASAATRPSCEPCLNDAIMFRRCSFLSVDSWQNPACIVCTLSITLAAASHTGYPATAHGVLCHHTATDTMCTAPVFMQTLHGNALHTCVSCLQCIVDEVQQTKLRERLYQRCHVVIPLATGIWSLLVNAYVKRGQLAAQQLSAVTRVGTC